MDMCKNPTACQFIQLDVSFSKDTFCMLQYHCRSYCFTQFSSPPPFALSAPTCLQVLYQNSPPIHSIERFVHNISHNSLRIHEKCVFFFVTKDIKGKSIEPHFPVTLLGLQGIRFLEFFFLLSFDNSVDSYNNCFVNDK